MCIKRGPRKKLARPSPRGAHGGIPHHSLLSELFSIHPRAFGFASAKPRRLRRRLRQRVIYRRLGSRLIDRCIERSRGNRWKMISKQRYLPPLEVRAPALRYSFVSHCLALGAPRDNTVEGDRDRPTSHPPGPFFSPHAKERKSRHGGFGGGGRGRASRPGEAGRGAARGSESDWIRAFTRY
jgi:hypothetical protein